MHTGACYSLFSVKYIRRSVSFQEGSSLLGTIGGEKLRKVGKYMARLDLEYSQLMENTFEVTSLPYGVLGTDFLSKFNLSVDTARRCLVKYLEAVRFFEDAVDSSDGDGTFDLRCLEKSDCLFFQKLNS